MTHTYKIHGMTCNGCRNHVERVLNSVEGVIKATVDLEKAEAIIDMKTHIHLDTFQKALIDDGTSYTIAMPDDKDAEAAHQAHIKTVKAKNSGPGTYYCPMQCEGDKTYDKPGDCPVCGMDLVKEVRVSATATKYTCPMHPEVVQDGPGSCPKCGMDLVPMEPDDSEEDATYKSLLRKLWIAVAFTLPIFVIAMSEMIPNNPLYDLMDLEYRFGNNRPTFCRRQENHICKANPYGSYASALTRFRQKVPLR